MEQSILIRVDSSSRIGTGHVFRCLRLAKELKRRGARVAFMCADLPGNISNSISSHGFEVELIDSPVDEGDMKSIESPWPKGAQIFDAANTLKGAGTRNAEVVVVDQYGLGELWENQVASGGFRVIALDDLPEKLHSSEIVVRPGLSSGARSAIDSDFKVRELSGLRYAMVSREFCEVKNFRKRVNDSATKRVMVYFGGVDAGNASEKVVDAIVRSRNTEYFIELVLGSGNTRCEGLSKKYEASTNVTVHNSLSSLSELVGKCHAAVGAGGVSAFERAAAGLPSILFSLTENQIAPCKELDTLGLAKYFGDFDSFSSGDFSSRFSLFMHGLNNFSESPHAPKIIDCLGVERIAELIHPSSKENLVVRVASPSDLGTYFGWVNDHSVRNNSLNSRRIEFQEHSQWFMESLSDPSVVMLLFQFDYLPIAQVRFKLNEDCWSLNYSLDEIVRGRGWAKEILGQSVNWLRSHRDSRRIEAVVKVSNLASMSALTASGFVPQSVLQGSETLTLYLQEA